MPQCPTFLARIVRGPPVSELWHFYVVWSLVAFVFLPQNPADPNGGYCQLPIFLYTSRVKVLGSKDENT